MKQKCISKISGFTLLELVIVVVIIGVLSILALPRMVNSIKCAKAMEMVPFIAQLRRAMEVCALQNGGNYSNCFAGNIGTLNLNDYGGYCAVGSTYIPEEIYDGEIDDTGLANVIAGLVEDDGDGDCDVSDMLRILETSVYFLSFYDGEHEKIWTSNPELKGCFKFQETVISLKIRIEKPPTLRY
ncbi:MAG: prepilin-type N-terminal cleavage/methylation domain-containing protein [Candidatus Omnitrophota bacterium]